MDIVVWLRSLGLGKYEAAFRENEIDETVLPSLTHEDLKELGVAAVGHRRKFLDAIAALRTNATVKAPSTNALPAPSAHPEDHAERRQLTVMFSGLVGSAALSASMDPEDLLEITAAYHRCVAETVRHFDGFAAQFMGDGVLVYFGYPLAHEDDAERAVLAALELITAVSNLKAHSALQTRVGIATGLVVIDELTGSGEAEECGIVGETLNLAARLQEGAEPNSVIIAEGTRKLLGNLFELEGFEAKDLKGFSWPVRAFAVLRRANVESRFDAFHKSILTEMVGREEELELLLRRWSRAKSGQGQVVLLSGEAGIGKSRLTLALLERLAPAPHTRLRYFCSQQHTSSAFFPIIRQMERAAGVAHDVSSKEKLDKLDTLLAQSFALPQDAALCAEMLSLPNDGRYPKLGLAPQQRRRKTLEALTAQLEALSRSNPVLMIFEDLQWIDPTSLEALDRAVERIKTLRALLIVTFRLEFEPPWIGRPHATLLNINRLGKREIAAMIDDIAGNKLLPVSIRQNIVERADGIPLFVEEMTKAVLEAGNKEAAEQAVAAIPSPTVAVPASLHASLMARLDRLGSAKEVAQIGAVIGREFSHALLAAVAHKVQEELQSALNRLVAAGLLFRQGVPPHATYLFKHALVQDAAYGTLLREPRRALHARIADTLEAQFTDTAEKQPEMLARHCTEGGLIEKAASLWGKAGQRSLARSALVEAVEQLRCALSQMATLPGTPSQRREEIDLAVALINPLMHLKGYAAPETKTAAEQARLLIEQADALGEPPEDPLLLFSVLYGVWAVNHVTFNGNVCCDLSAHFLTLAEKQGATVPRMIGHRLMGISLLSTGEAALGRAHLDHAMALYDPAEHRPLATRFGVDARVSVLCFRSFAQWMLGYPEAALADTNNALKEARRIGQAATLMYALGHAPLTRFHCGDYATGNTEADELVALADEKDASFWKEWGRLVRGCGMALSGNASDAVHTITFGITALRSTGATLWMPLQLLHLSRAYAELCQFDDASRCIGEAMTAAQITNERWYEADLHRIAGEVALGANARDPINAQSHFESALAVARQQQAKSWELRASMSLARFWRDQGKVSEARELLAPVYGWFTEGFDTRDLKEAKRLLEELAA